MSNIINYFKRLIEKSNNDFNRKHYASNIGEDSDASHIAVFFLIIGMLILAYLL